MCLIFHTSENYCINFNLISLYDKRLWFNFLMYFEEKFSFHEYPENLTKPAKPGHPGVYFFSSMVQYIFTSYNCWDSPSQKKICLRLVKGWHRWIHGNMPKMIPFGSFTLFFLSQATQRFTQLDLKLFSRFQNCLGNCQREYTNVGVTVRANVTARARQAPSYPPDGSVALGCVIWSSNATCPRPHELVN